MRRTIYVETLVRAPLDQLWERTQDPGQHQRWDVRFGTISHLPQAEGEPQAFRYATRLLPGLTVAGTGVSVGERWRDDGSCTSALTFASPHPLSLLAQGSGYWRYVPGEDGVRFLTGYDYRPRWGRPGAVADRWLLRPLMGWATAWSFDRLRLWLERGLTPERSRNQAVLEVVVRLALVVAAWIASPWAAPAACVGVLLVPPLPGTPAARRCLRRPTAPVRAPRILDRLTIQEAS